MSRREFEQLVQAAARSKRPLGAPRLIEARYRAALTDASLTGTAQWKILHPGNGPALLRLSGDGAAFNLAVKLPRFDNRDAVLTSFPDADGKGRSLALFVDRPGEHTVTFEWSARAEQRSDGQFLDLRLPACPAGSFELELPVGRQLSVADGSPVSGPHPASVADRRTWRVGGGKAHLALQIHDVTGRAGLLFARHKMTQRLSPDGVETASSFTVECQGRDVRELTFEFDPLLRPVEVEAPAIENWDASAPGRLVIRLAKPLREGVVDVRCVGPLIADRATDLAWVSPQLRLAGAISRGEALELLVHPDLRMLSWRPGDFLLTDLSQVADPETGTTFRRLALLGGGLTSPGGQRRPAATVQAGGVEYRARQHSWWRLGGGMELTCLIDYDLRQGQLFELTVRLPAGWEVDTAETTPSDLLRTWRVLSDKSGQLLLAELRRPLRPGAADSAASLLIKLRRSSVEAGADLPFPDVVPVGARLREGGLAIDFDEQAFRSRVQSPLAAGEAPLGGPWGKVVPDYYYPFRGEALAGMLRLDARPPRLRASVASEVLFTTGQAVVETRLTLEGEAGSAAFVDVFLAGGDDRPWEWRTARVERLVANEVASALAPMGAFPLALARPAGSWWRLWLDRPLGVRQTTTLRATRQLAPREGHRWDVPLVTVAGARTDGEVTLHLAAGETVAVGSVGLTETRPGVSGWRSYRYSEGVPRLTLEARPRGAGPRPDAAIERARLTTTLTTSGESRHYFRFRLTRWPRTSLPVKLPSGARLLAVAVGGEWLEQAGSIAEDKTLALPVPANTEPALFELLYTTPTAPWFAWVNLAAAAPELPIAPESFERRWLLPPGVVPVGDALAVPHSSGPTPGPMREATRRALSDGCAALCAAHGGATLPLGEVIEELAGASLGATHPLLIDRAALTRAGLGVATMVTLRAALDDSEAPQPWDNGELALLPVGGAVLLTTRGQVGSLPDAWLGSVAESGQDESGRYITAVEWLARSRPTPPPRGLLDVGGLPGWTTWTPVGGASKAHLLVIREAVVSAAGSVLAGLLAAAMVVARRCSSVTRARLLLAWLAITGLALAWLPGPMATLAWGPFVVGGALSAAWYFLWALRRPQVMAAGLVIILFGVSRAAAPVLADADEGLVFLVADGDDPTGSVLVRPSLVDKLQAMAKPPLGAPAGAVLVSAEYDGKLIGDRTEFSATLQAYLFGDEPATLELPFDEVQLVGDVLLDGARVLPTALARGGYAVRVSGAGRHKVELRFQVALGRLGDDDTTQQARFVAPPLAQNRLSFQVPNGATHPRVAQKHGGQRVVGEGERRVLEADLGAIGSAVLVRWCQEAKPPKPVRVEFREAYLWDLRADASVLTALLRYAVRGGAVSSLFVDLPDGLQVRTATARRPSGEKGLFAEARTPSDSTRLIGWAVEGMGEARALKLNFPVPVSGTVEVTLELVPTSPWMGQVPLPLPRPRGEPEPKTPGFLAYRRHGLEVTRTNWLRLTGIKAAEFAPFWPAGPLLIPGTLDYASSFRRDARQAPPELVLAMQPAAPALDASQEVTWQVGPTRAELSARIDLAAPDKDLSLIEIEIDSARTVTVASVTGPEVGRWSQSGNRLLVWLEKSTGSARLDITGWVPLGLMKDGPARLDLPCLRVLATAKARARLTLRPTAGLVLASPVLRQLTPDTVEGVYHAKLPNYGASFTVQPGPTPSADVEMTAQAEGKELAFVATLEYRTQGEVRALNVRLRGWDGDAWLETPGKTEARRREQHRRSGGRRERSWALDLVPGVSSLYRMTLRGRVSLEGAVSLPEIVVTGAVTGQVVRLDTGLEVESALGIVPDKAGWRVGAEGWVLRVAARPNKTASPVSVLLTEGRSWTPDGARWRHEARLWVRHESSAEVLVRLPAGAESARAAVDGGPGVAVDGEAWLPLTGAGGVREVVVQYQFPARTESLDRPDLTSPRAVGPTCGPIVWTVDVPPGWEVMSSSGGVSLGAGPTRRAVVELHRATVEQAAKRPTKRHLALARLALKCGADARRPLGPGGSELGSWLTDLEKAASEPGTTVEVVEGVTHFGTPYGWQRDQPEGELVVRLEPSSRGQVGRALMHSCQWLTVILVALAVTTSPQGRGVARRLWPEVLVLAALVGGYIVGPTPAVLSLAAAGMASRAVTVVRLIRRP